MVDRYGLVMDTMDGLRDFQQALQKTDDLNDWEYSGDYPSLLDVMHCACQILIGVRAGWLVHRASD